MTKHATAHIGEYTIPLIGVPPDATDETCEVCKTAVHIRDIVIVDGVFKCQDCIAECK